MKCLSVVFLILCFTKMARTVYPEVVVSQDSVNGLVGDDLILHCYLKNNLSAVDMDVQWINQQNELVHHYKERIDTTDDQLPAYHNRTSLFKDELQKGNISLKLRSVRLSDTNTYRCYVSGGSGSDEASINLKVIELEKPMISAESHKDGKVSLTCMFIHTASIEWLNSKEEVLQQTAKSDYCDINRTSLYIRKSVTVQEEDGHNFTCRVSYLNYTINEPYSVDGNLFAKTRHHWFLFLILLVLNIMAIALWLNKPSLKGVLKQIKTQVIRQECRSNCYIKPRIIQTVGADDQQTYRNIFLEHLFNPGDDSVQPAPKVIILHGRSGHGKSVTAQKIVCDWASGAEYLKQFDLVLLLKSEDLNHQMKNPSVKRELVDLVCSWKKFRYAVHDTLMKSPDKVLFLIDGFDELVLSENRTLSTTFSPFSPQSVEDHILALLSGHSLRDCFLLVTTRNSSSDRLRQLIKRGPERTAQILGFSKDDERKYFEEFFKSTGKSYDELYNVVQAYEILSASCCIPVVCDMICSILKYENESVKMDELKTVTSIFQKLVISLVNRRYSKTTIDCNLVKDLVLLAEGGVLTKKNRSSKDLSNLKKNPFLCRNHPQNQFKFKHRVFQEFFTALHRIIPDTKPDVGTLLNTLKDKTLIKNTHHLPMIRFLCGLSNSEVRLPEILDDNDKSSIQNSLKAWICEEMGKKQPRYLRLFLLRCLYELHNKDVVKEAMGSMDTIDLSSTFLNKLDCLVLQYCLKCCPNIICLKLRKCHLTAEELKLLTPALDNLQELRLDVEDLADADVKGLISSLENGLLSKDSSPQEPLKHQVVIRLSTVNAIHTDTAVSLLQTFLKSKKHSSVSVEFVEKKDNVKKVKDDFPLEEQEEKDECVPLTFMSVEMDSSDLEGKEERDDEECVPLASMSVEMDSSEVVVMCRTAVSLISLSISPSEESSPTWTELINGLTRQTNSRQEGGMRCVRQFMKTLSGLRAAQLIVNDLIQTEADEMFSELVNSHDLMDLGLTTVRKSESKNGTKKETEGRVRDSVCLSFSKVKSGIYRLKVTGYNSLEILLTLSEKPQLHLLTRLFENIRNMEHKTEQQALNQQMDKVLCSVNNLHGIKDMNLRVKSLTETWVNGVISLFQRYSTLLDLKIAVAEDNLKEVAENNPANVCSSISLKKLEKSLFRVTANCSSEVLNVSFILRLGSAQMYMYTKILREITDKNTKLDGIVPLNELKCVDLRVHILTESWVQRILSVIDQKQEIKVEIFSDNDNDEESLCSSASFEKDANSFSLTADNWMVSSSHKAPVLSHISVTSKTHSADWLSLLKQFYNLKTLTDRNPNVEAHLNEFMESLQCLDGLTKIKLSVSSLTENWSERIVNLVQRCPSLKDVSFSAGLNVVAGELTVWVEYGHLQKDGIESLQNSDLKDCNITVSGVEFSTLKRNHRDHPVKLKKEDLKMDLSFVCEKVEEQVDSSMDDGGVH